MATKTQPKMSLGEVLGRLTANTGYQIKDKAGIDTGIRVLQLWGKAGSPYSLGTLTTAKGAASLRETLKSLGFSLPDDDGEARKAIDTAIAGIAGLRMKYTATTGKPKSLIFKAGRSANVASSTVVAYKPSASELAELVK